MLDEIAVMTRPGAVSRQPEVVSVAAALERWRTCVRIEAPGTLDGGDVLRVGRDLYVGESGRSNAAGIAQLASAIAPFGYRTTGRAAARLPAPQECRHLRWSRYAAHQRRVGRPRALAGHAVHCRRHRRAPRRKFATGRRYSDSRRFGAAHSRSAGSCRAARRCAGRIGDREGRGRRDLLQRAVRGLTRPPAHRGRYPCVQQKQLSLLPSRSRK